MMMKIKSDTLIILNSRKKVQVASIWIEELDDNAGYEIHRTTGQFGGKQTPHPVITVTTGKVKRSPLEQVTLQYKALVKNHLDKGYINLNTVTDKSLDELGESELRSFLNDDATDQFGMVKPMLAKLADQCKDDIWKKDWYVSRKLDGVRCLFYYKDDEIKTASRGGGNYDAATKHLREDKNLIEIFRLKPDLILDGELYHHGADWPLQRISGLARQQEWKEECSNLEYWVYDIVEGLPFEIRWNHLKGMRSYLSVDSKIKILDQKKMSGYENIKPEHDKYVQEGFEGLCARNPDKGYGVNKRSADYLVKLKERKDAEFEIIGIRTGLRDEDMCFTLKTADGKEFAAKPVGDIESRKYFLEHYKEFIGKKATCTYFTLSQDGVPTQPVLKSIRPDDE